MNDDKLKTFFKELNELIDLEAENSIYFGYNKGKRIHELKSKVYSDAKKFLGYFELKD